MTMVNAQRRSADLARLVDSRAERDQARQTINHRDDVITSTTPTECRIDAIESANFPHDAAILEML
jgi:hypothetical protein